MNGCRMEPLPKEVNLDQLKAVLIALLKCRDNEINKGSIFITQDVLENELNEISRQYVGYYILYKRNSAAELLIPGAMHCQYELLTILSPHLLQDYTLDEALKIMNKMAAFV